MQSKNHKQSKNLKQIAREKNISYQSLLYYKRKGLSLEDAVKVAIKKSLTPSIKKAARENGVPESTVSYYIKKKGLCLQDAIDLAKIAKETNNKRPEIREIAKKAGVPISYITNNLKRGLDLQEAVETAKKELSLSCKCNPSDGYEEAILKAAGIEIPQNIDDIKKLYEDLAHYLTSNQRKILELIYGTEMSLREVACYMNISKNAPARTRDRALKSLKECYESGKYKKEELDDETIYITKEETEMRDKQQPLQKDRRPLTRSVHDQRKESVENMNTEVELVSKRDAYEKELRAFLNKLPKEMIISQYLIVVRERDIALKQLE